VIGQREAQVNVDPTAARSRVPPSSTRLGLEQSRALLEQSRTRLADDPALEEVSLLPPTAEPVPAAAAVWVSDLEVAGRYIPMGAGGSGPVAGDFYDVLRTGADRVALVVGDVTGHGPAALGRMRVLRQAARAVAREQLGARSALAALDAFLDGQPEEGLATLWYGEYVPSIGQLVYANAGHPPPVLTGHGRLTELLALADAPPLGTGLAHELAAERTIHLPTGAALLAYSDGLIERAHADLTDQLALLRDLTTTHADPGHDRTAQQIADAILHALIPDPAAAHDDVCLLVVRRHTPGTTDRSIAMTP
jgi:serine phosphatase RsbU (regulator of sigma subunit)